MSKRGICLKTITAAVAAVALSGCVSMRSRGEWDDIYGPITTDRFPIPAIDTSTIDPALLRRVVRYDTTEAPGTIVVDTHSRKLYRVEEGGMATRYPIAVGREGLSFRGAGVIGRKAEWRSGAPMVRGRARRPARLRAFPKRKQRE